jgi:hypothetical protein
VGDLSGRGADLSRCRATLASRKNHAAHRARVIEQSWEDWPFSRSGPTTRSNYQTDYRTASVQKRRFGPSPF